MPIILVLLLSLWLSLSAVADEVHINGELLIHGENSQAMTIKPKARNEYAPLKWLDQYDNNIGMIVCHEYNSHGELHNHCSWYTALKDRSKRTGRVDLTFGEDFANWTFESVFVDFEKGAFIEPVLSSPKGLLYEITVDDQGNMTTQLIESLSAATQ